MSHFYADIKGNRKERTCCGTKQSGIRAHIRGWKTGIWVLLSYDEKTDSDIIRVYLTGGSNGPVTDQQIFDGGISHANSK